MGSIRSMFPDEYHQQSPVGEFFQTDQSRPSSSSSSLRSLSVGSPEYTSLILSKPSTSAMPDACSLRKASMEQVAQQGSTLVPPHQMTMPPYGQVHNAHFPTPTGDDAAMARAILAVISSPASSSSAHDPLPQINKAQQSHSRRRGAAFTAYDSSRVPVVEAKQASRSQGMIKRAFSILRQIRPALTDVAHVQTETRSTSNQLHHMISERKRREKLNESFAALRMLLPPGAKRDKASVLASTIEYLNSLKSAISNLKEKNRSMESRLLLPEEAGEGDDASGERVRSIRIVRASESSSELQQIELRVTVWVECDMIDLVLHMLECLKEMRGIKLVSLDASTHPRPTNPIRWAILKIQIKGDEWDECWFREAVARAVDASLERPETAAPP